jgi:glycerol-3-phosphate dehydrogenase
MESHPAFDRGSALCRLAEERFDVLVVGGGITGAGVALDAAARGLRTALVERDDFAQGTSSRSSKLVHGGLRYLRRGELGLVREGLAERQRLLENAPHLVEPLSLVMPLFRRGELADRLSELTVSLALGGYDLAGGSRIRQRHRRIGASEVLDLLPGLHPERVRSGFVYWDAHTDDARLTLAVVRTAALDYGAVAVNHAPVTALLSDPGGRVQGATVAALAGGHTELLDVAASVVVNATGVWADEVRALAGEDQRALRPAKGVHLTVSRERLPWRSAAVLPVPGDRRTIFVIPWGPDCYLGTTDTDYVGPLEDPRCDQADLSYVLGALNAASSVPLGPKDITGAWAGLRPLLSLPRSRVSVGRSGRSPSTADLSRRHQVTASPVGLVTVTGGKLTSYRAMAADATDQVVRLLGKGARRSPTRRLALRGATGAAELKDPSAAGRLGLDPFLLAHLVDRYGGEAAQVASLVRQDPGLAEPLVAGLPYVAAEAVHAVRAEMAVTLEDVLSRRLRALPRRRHAAVEAAPRVCRLVARELGWSPEVECLQLEALDRAAEAYRVAPTAPASAGRTPEQGGRQR